MKKHLLVILLAIFAVHVRAQNPGLVISEILANPAGTDSCKEYVELIATQNINFSLTPYTIIVSNNGNATSQGWINSALNYAFAITTGSVAAGDVVYVGGSCMAPSGTKLRALDVKYVNGDGGLGVAAAAGVFGNGGSNADAVAVFNLPVSAITSSTVPTDAVFYGTGIGSALVNSGADGYQLPVNDLYIGGKLQNISYFAPDPASDILITAAGLYNVATSSWTTPRTISTGTVMTNASSSVSLTTTGTVSPASVSFFSNDTTVSEASPSANVYLKLTAASTASSSISVYVSALSNASAADYTLANITVTFAANAPVNSTAPVTVNISNDNIPESAEYIILRLYNPQNATVGSINQFAFYIGDNDKVIPAPSNAITMNLLSSFSNGASGANSAEIVAHDPGSQRLFIANSVGAKLDIIDFVNPSSPSLLVSVPVTTYGNINSVAVKNGIVALAIENGTNPQDSGKVVFMNTNGTFLNQVKVGMMPDMITFNQAGTKVLTANEGEPNAAYTSDPDGSISIIDISGGIASLNQSMVSHITFTAFNGQELALRAQGIRIFGLNASASKDFEPEYISVAKDDSKAWVTLQENNAIVEIDLTTNSLSYIKALGTKNHNLPNSAFDASNVTRGINNSSFPVKGFYLPDAIASYTVGGVNYLITANEGDSRAYTGFSEEKRVAQLSLDPVKFPQASELKNNYVLGRLTVTDKNGDIDNDGDIDTIYAYGSRSFSIWNASTGNLVYDSKDDFEQITATSSFSNMFNVSNSNAVKKDRSDDKGPEPEGVTIGTVGSSIYAFIALERIGGVMVYDVTNPNAPVFVTYVNNRSLPSNGPDLGAEGVIFIPQSQSPNGQNIVVAANEVSSTLSIWGIPGCTTPLSSSLTVNGPVNGACASNAPVISVPASTGATYQWSRNGTAIPGATSNTISANATGNYSVAISNGTNCATSSITKSISVNPTPTLSITGPSVVCAGASVTQTISGATTYSYNGAATSTLLSFTPAASGNYTVSGADANNCIGTLVKPVVVNALPLVNLYAVPAQVCTGESTTLTATGATSYSWSTGASSSAITLTPSATSGYSVTGTNANGCSSRVSKTVTVNPLPAINASAVNPTVCAGEIAVLNASGGISYLWNTGAATSSLTVNPSATTVYTVTGTNAFNCSAKVQVIQAVSECTSLRETLQSRQDYVVYPNPGVKEIRISYSGEFRIAVKLINAFGTVVLEERDYTADAGLNISGLSKGVYFVQITAGSQHSLKKLIVE